MNKILSRNSYQFQRSEHEILCESLFSLPQGWKNRDTISECAAAATKPLQSWPTLCDPIDSSLPGSSIPGILQTRKLEWVAISFSNAWKWKVKVKSLSCVRRFTTPWTVAHQAPLSVGFSRQEYWSGVPFPSPISECRDIINSECRYIQNKDTGLRLFGLKSFSSVQSLSCVWFLVTS